MPRVKLLYALMIAGTFMCLFQIWWPAYYVTGDGACHLYNAHILHSWYNNTDVSFYKEYYTLVTDPNPNWLSHILLSLLMYVAPAVIAEKILLSLYAALVITGFYKLLKFTSGSSSYWISVVFLFVFHHTLAKGFYNFSLGTAMYFWMVLCWLVFIEKKNVLNTTLFFVVSGITFFAQLLPFVFGVITCSMLAVSFTATQQNKLPFINRLLQNQLVLGILCAPFIALMFWFTSSQGGLNIHLQHHFYRIIELIQFKYLICASNGEELFAGITGLAVISLFIYSIIYRIAHKQYLHKYDGLLYAVMFISFVYLFFPEDFMQRAILISMRAQLFVMVLAVVIIGIALPQKIKNAGGWILFACFCGLTITRVQVMQEASVAVTDINSVATHIKPYSVVLPVNLSPNGENKNGTLIADRNYIFSHAFEYSGCYKPMIMLDNYEANTGYFPLIWQYSRNPYVHLSNSAEGQPTSVRFADYRASAGILPNYVLIYGSGNRQHPDAEYNAFNDSLQLYYQQQAVSASGLTRLFILKGQP